MYGKNAVASPDQRDDGSLRVHGLWYTIQGEGPDAGQPAIFLRLAKCNLRCWFCDTEFEGGERQSLIDVVDSVRLLSKMHNCRLVVLTGGEPLLQNVVPLITALNRYGIGVSVETAGTVYVPGLEELFSSGLESKQWRGNLIVCSPKTPLLNPRLIGVIGAFKYVVSAGEIDPDDGLPTMSTQLVGHRARIFRPTLILRSTVPIYLQPCDTGIEDANVANLKAAASACMKHGYRLSVQVHKMAELP